MKKVFLTSLLVLTTALFVRAQDVTVESIEFGTDVQDRQIVGANTSFDTDVERVYCFTRITGVQENATIAHIWYHNDEERARVDLPVRSADWRTWSSKTILPSWTGKWSVDVVGPNGEVLATESFTIED